MTGYTEKPPINKNLKIKSHIQTHKTPGRGQNY